LSPRQWIAASRNGAAKAALLAIKRRDQAQLLEEQRRLDEHTCLLLGQRDDVLREIDQERGRRDLLRAEVDELERQMVAMRKAIGATEGELVVHLRELDERGVLEPILEACGWLVDPSEAA
jgi:hypothetical protein